MLGQVHSEHHLELGGDDQMPLTRPCKIPIRCQGVENGLHMDIPLAPSLDLTSFRSKLTTLSYFQTDDFVDEEPSKLDWKACALVTATHHETSKE